VLEFALPLPLHLEFRLAQPLAAALKAVLEFQQ
jgi:hypothetical protein